MIPNVPRETLLEAMEEFDKNLRDTRAWSHWEQKGTHKFAIAHNDRYYPVKQIIRMATSETNFSGGYEANSYVTKRGLSIVPLRNDQDETDSMSIRDGLEEIVARYALARASESFKGNELWATFKEVANAIAATSAAKKRPTLRVKPSMGQGNWATIPWIALLDNRETSITQRGVYGVYLFREDMSGVYVKLGQGVTEPKELYGAAKGREYIRARGKTLRQYCGNLTQHEFALDDNIDLHTNADLGTVGLGLPRLHGPFAFRPRRLLSV